MAGSGDRAVATLSHSRTLFLDDCGVPLRFYMPPGPTKALLAPMIIHGGGVVCCVREPGAILLTDSTAEGPMPKGYISTRYVLDSVEQDKQLALEEYATEQASPKAVTALGRGRLTYSEEEDAAILSYVRSHGDRSVAGNALWMEMEGNNVTSHSWQSMKSRYLRGREQRDSAKGKRPATSARTALEAASGEGKRNLDNLQQAELKSNENATTSVERQSDADADGDEECFNIFHVAIREFEVEDDTPELMVEMGSEMEMEKVSQKQEIENDNPPQVSPAEHRPRRKGTLAEFIMDNKQPEIDSRTPVDELFSLPTASQDEVECAIRAINTLMQTHQLDLCAATQLLLKNNGELTAAMHYMETGHRPDGYPIWTHQDDIDLENVDGQVQERLIQKFGSENLAKRIAFRNI